MLQIKITYLIFAMLFNNGGKKVNNQKTSTMNKEVAVRSETNITKYDNFSNVEEMLAYGQQMIKSGLTPLTKAEDVVVAIVTGLALGIKPAIAVQQIYPINGRGTIGVHIITGLLLKAGILYEVLEDYVPLYKYKDRSNNVLEQDEVDSGNYQIISKNTPKEAFIAGKVPVIKILTDRKTTIRFTRELRKPNSGFAVMTITETYHLSQTAESIIKKDNWANNEKQMMFVACMRLGARKIADDLLQGMPETSELLDLSNKNYNMDEEGKVTVLDDNRKEVIEVEQE